jgi:predicted acyltransferase
LEKQRILSIDVFRGLTMILMTIVNNPGSWDYIYSPLAHAEWHGCTPTDLVFPFFVFAMGMAIPFSTNENSGMDTKVFSKIFIRALRIFNIGLFLNFFSKITFEGLEGPYLMIVRLFFALLIGWALLGNFTSKTKLLLALSIFFTLITLAYSGIENFASLRILGVLQRLGLVYFFAILVFLIFKFKTQVFIAILILLGYWAAMALIPVPGFGTPNFEKGTNLSAWLDNLLLPGHLWASAKTWDPEGILSTFPAIVTALIGIWTGKLVKSNIQNLNRWLFIYGISFLIVGKIWDFSFPINKALWTSSYVVYSAGWAMLVFGLINSLIANARINPIIKFLIMWGVNPMIVFYGSGILPRALNMIKVPSEPKDISLLTYLYEKGLAPIFSNPLNSSLSYALIYVVFWSLILKILEKRKLVFKV